MTDTPPEDNPLLKAYESFVRATPLVTRHLIQSQFATWLVSFVLDLPLAVGNVPHFTVHKLEVYRLILSPFVCHNLFSLVFTFISYVEIGSRMEFVMGSTAYGWLLLTITVLVNALHVLLAFVLFGITGNRVWLFQSSVGIWIVVFAVISIDCSQASPGSSRRLFFFTVPTKYYPIALMTIFSLLGGFQLCYPISIAFGFAYQLGYLEFLKVDNTRFQRWESTTLASLVEREGWVALNAVRNADWKENGATEKGLGFFPRMLSSHQTQRQDAVSDTVGDVPPGVSHPGRAVYTGGGAASVSNVAGANFPSGGRQLGTTSRRTHVDPRQARLEALEKRSIITSNDDKV